MTGASPSQPMSGCLSAEDREALDAVFIAHIKRENAALVKALEEAKRDAKNFGETMCETNDRLLAAQDEIAALKAELVSCRACRRQVDCLSRDGSET